MPLVLGGLRLECAVQPVFAWRASEKLREYVWPQGRVWLQEF